MSHCVARLNDTSWGTANFATICGDVGCNTTEEGGIVRQHLPIEYDLSPYKEDFQCRVLIISFNFSTVTQKVHYL